jgi:DNA-binding CsgD family transcriptional regulator
MAEPAIPALTDAQKACLILVAQGGSSKEIGPRLGLAYRTVDQYVNDAQHSLGATDRRDAARVMLSILEDGELKKLQQKFPALVGLIPSTSMRPRTQSRGRVGGSWLAAISFLFPPPLAGGSHELNPVSKLAEMARAANLLAVIVVGLILLFAGALRLLS